MDTDKDQGMLDQERQVSHLAADVVRATQAYVRTRKFCANVENSATALESSLVSLVEEVYAMECEWSLDPAIEACRDGETTSPGGAIHALAAEFIASLVQRPGEQAGAGELPVRTSVLLGCEFDALSDALRVAGYLEPVAAFRPVPA